MMAPLFWYFWHFVILRRYIVMQVLITTMFVLGFLVVMLLGGRLIRYFGIVVEGGLQLSFLFQLIGYNSPFFLALILPLSFFIALMLVFGRLYADSEMVVLNAGGISRNDLGKMMIPLVLALMAVHGFLTLVAQPWGLRSAQMIWQNQSLAQVFDLVRPKQFISSGDYHLYVGELGDNREFLKDVIVIHTQKSTQDNIANPTSQDIIKDTLIFARLATQVATYDNTVQLDLHEGRRYELNNQSLSYNQIDFKRYRISLESKDYFLPAAEVEEQSTSTLLTAVATDHKAAAELYYRLCLPFLMILAPLLALPLSQVAPRKGRWIKLVPATVIFVLAALILITLKAPIQKQKVGVWAYPVVLMAMLAFCFYINIKKIKPKPKSTTPPNMLGDKGA